VVGRLVDVLVSESQNAGTYAVEYSPMMRASGMYIYELKQGSSVLRNRMLLLK
jgi:hypothetical protein